MSTLIENQTFEEERTLYHLQFATISHCTFAGKVDGESPLKEGRNITLENCDFSLRYPLWHVQNFFLNQCTLDEKSRAGFWYDTHGILHNCKLDGIKAIRECYDIKLHNCHIHSPEFGWKSNYITLEYSDIESEYLFLDSKNVELSHVTMKGKYSFQYMENLKISDCHLDTKDAFWHSKNVTVSNSIVKGEYLGWYSENLTLDHCTIIGTQPLCYCKNLKLIDCIMQDTDLAFEYSDVDAFINGTIDSVKNPRSGRIFCESIGEIIHDDPVMECHAEIITRT